jgi:stage II sporulation protein D
MKNQLLIYIGLTVLALLFLPLLLHDKEPTKQQARTSSEQNSKSFNLTIPTKITLSASNEQIPLDDYVMGVVAAEMPASFHPEALKAQAVAARTYAIHQTNKLVQPIQTSTIHQVYFPVNNLSPEYEEKIKAAVEATKNEVVTYDNQIISAMFHAASNGQTESALNFSGNDYPYLQSVKSLETKEQEMTFTLIQINHLLRTKFTLSDITNAKITKNETERVKTIQIGSETWTGREFREHLQLPSTDFTISVNNNAIIIKTKGYGHGVGMSQVGAHQLAEGGYSYKEILAHYYKNTKVNKIKYIDESGQQ